MLIFKKYPQVYLTPRTDLTSRPSNTEVFVQASATTKERKKDGQKKMKKGGTGGGTAASGWGI